MFWNNYEWLSAIPKWLQLVMIIVLVIVIMIIFICYTISEKKKEVGSENE